MYEDYYTPGLAVPNPGRTAYLFEDSRRPRNNGNGVKKAFFRPYVIEGILRKPKDTRRNMPFYLSYPAKYKEEIEIKLIDRWTAEESFDKIETSSFLMTGNVTYKHGKFLLDYEYENLKDHVLPEQLNEYMECLKPKTKILVTSCQDLSMANHCQMIILPMIKKVTLPFILACLY